MVLGDFLQYMKTCAQKYIEKTHAEGKVLWEEVNGRIIYILRFDFPLSELHDAYCSSPVVTQMAGMAHNKRR